jgi:hypothetical protein
MCNTPPSFSQDAIWYDSAFFERFRFFEWKHQIDAEKITDVLPELTSPRELSGIANYLIWHLLENRKKKNWGFDWDWQRSKSIWRGLLSENDIIGNFLKEECIAATSVKQGIPTMEFYSRLMDWCNHNHFQVPRSVDVSEAMKTKASEGRIHKKRSYYGIAMAHLRPGNAPRYQGYRLFFS